MANHSNEHGPQWELLKALGSRATVIKGIFCAPYYLLYNGFSGKCRSRYIKSHKPDPETIAAAWRSSLGCSLVEVDAFHRISAPRPPAKTYQPLYHELHNLHTLKPGGPALPWHKLLKTRLPKKQGFRLLTDQELTSRLKFYRDVVTPLAEPTVTNYYYYYYDGQDHVTNEDGRLLGRYAIVIGDIKEMERIFA